VHVWTEFETLAYRVDERIATITLNRPDKMNAFNGQMMHDLRRRSTQPTRTMMSVPWS